MRKNSVLFLIILLCISSFIEFPCKADTLWSDDFNDGNYDGWTVLNGTFTVEDGKLKAGLGDYNIIIFSSYNAYGTWSFDILPNSMGIDMSVILIGTYPISYRIIPLPQQGLGIRASSTLTGLILTKIKDGSSVNLSGFGCSVSAWQHIDVTRNQDERICVYDNGTLVVDVVDTSVTTTSEYLLFWSSRGAVIDNIIASDTVDIQPPAAPFYMQPWFIPSIAAVVLVLVVTVVFLLRRK